MAETSPDAGWRTQHLRLTAFPETEEPLLLVRDWWHAIAGSPPLRELTNPQGGTVELMGVYKDAPLGMEAQRGRVDIRRPYAMGEQPADALPLLSEVLAAFVDLAGGWLKREGTVPASGIPAPACVPPTTTSSRARSHQRNGPTPTFPPFTPLRVTGVPAGILVNPGCPAGCTAYSATSTWFSMSWTPTTGTIG